MTEPSETMSGRRDYPQETWDADDEPESELPVPRGQLVGGKYTVEGAFAEGGMGIVCLGRHVQLDQQVAIKFLRRNLSGRPSIVQRFLNEARALAALRSEHVVRVMDVGQLESGRPYLVMEHLEGLHLDAVLEQQGALPVATAVSYVLQVCEPLAEAHALGIVHRDIKPENLFLWSGGPARDIVKVLDFGLAKQLGSPKALGVTGPQESLGSPGYMSPEQITTPQLVDSRTDIWSLGVVLYRLLTNALPFDGASLVEVLSHILNAAPRSISTFVPGVAPELDAIVARCLEKAPDARYQSMSELAAALSAFVAEPDRASLPAEPAAAFARVGPSVPPPVEQKIRIAGVHSRWPTVVVGLAALFGAALYQADHSGLIRLRNLTDGWLTPSRLALDAAALDSRNEPSGTPLPLFRGVSAGEPVRDSEGAMTLRAAPERETTVAPAVSAEAIPVSMDDAQRAARQAAYREYLTSQGLTPVGEVALPMGDADGDNTAAP